MLELRPCCEHCGRQLPPDSTEAMICSFECTYCGDCVETVLHNVCPNCGGGLERRPVRPKEKLAEYPAKTERFVRAMDDERFQELLAKNRDIAPSER